MITNQPTNQPTNQSSIICGSNKNIVAKGGGSVRSDRIRVNQQGDCKETGYFRRYSSYTQGQYSTENWDYRSEWYFKMAMAGQNRFKRVLNENYYIRSSA